VEGLPGIEVENKFGVGINRGGMVSVLFPPQVMSKDEALVYAATIVALCDPTGEKFPRVLEHVRNT
jgi:hypothetical protein